MTTVYNDQRQLDYLTPLSQQCLDNDHTDCPGTVDLIVYVPAPTAYAPNGLKGVEAKSICICACHFTEQLFGGVKRWSD
jgi:hypothetical protein